jgi:hypothetical protein
MADLESQILAKELGKLGGIGARFAARFLSSVSHDNSFAMTESTNVVKQRVDEFFEEFGKPIPEFPSNPEEGKYSAIVGSGHLNLNPTIVHVQLNETDGATTLSVHAIAKEGKIPQRSAERLVERIEVFLLKSA